MPILVSDTYILTEAYYGKPKEFVKAEKIIETITDAIYAEYGVKRRPGKKLNAKHLNESKEVRDLEKCINSVFKFKELNITFYGEGISINPAVLGRLEEDPAALIDFIRLNDPNAYTIPTALINIKKVFGKPVENSDIEAHVFVAKNLILAYDLTPQEVMGVILHEIGHQLDHSVFTLLGKTLPSPMTLMRLANDETASDAIEELVAGAASVLLSGQIARLYTIINRWTERFKESHGINKLFKAWYDTINPAVSFVRRANRTAYIGTITATGVLPLVVLLMASEPKSFFGYAGEKYADSIATSYGYGVEIASFNRKVQRDHTYIAKIPVINVMSDLMKTTSSVVFAYADPHPQSALRVYAQLKKLKREINDPNIPKEMKPELKRQIKDLEDMCDEMTSLRSNAKYGMLFTTMYNWLLIKVFKGYTDPREILELIWRHEE